MRKPWGGARSNRDPLHDVPRDLLPPPVVEPRGSRVSVPGQVPHVLQDSDALHPIRRTAPQVSGYPASAAPPTIAVAALLGLARWCRQRGQQSGVSPCADTDPDQSPPVLKRPSPHLNADLWTQLFSDVSCIALWISSEKILTRLYSILHWFHKRLEVNVKNPRENRCFQTVIVFSFNLFDNLNTCIELLKIAARLIIVSTSVNNEMWVKLRPQRPDPLGPTHRRPAARTRSPRRTVARPAPTDGRPSGGQP